MNVRVSDEMRACCPDFTGAAVEADVVNSRYSERLWAEIACLEERVRRTHTTESIKRMRGIEATRRVYKLCGKDPSRYRPSAEALLRRVLQGKALYQIDTLVDMINLASMAFGYSIGGFDASKFHGDTLTLGIGRHDEPYEGIGRGMINIGGMPVYRDADGGVGTPTSDHERTKIDITTTRILVLVNGYDGDAANVMKCAAYVGSLAENFASGSDVRIMSF